MIPATRLYAVRTLPDYTLVIDRFDGEGIVRWGQPFAESDREKAEAQCRIANASLAARKADSKTTP